MPATVVRIDPGQLASAASNHMAAAAASGTLLAKMDDDDAYGREHLWDLVLAQEYAQTQLVMKPAEFVYLAASDTMVQVYRGNVERYGELGAGGAGLMSRETFDRFGGYPVEKIRENGCQVYQTHGAGFVLVRHGGDHTWSVEDANFLDRALAVWPGREPDLARIDDMDASYMPSPFVTTAATQHDPPPQRVRYND